MKRILLTILFLLITCNAWAATYYVKTGGTINWAGTNSLTVRPAGGDDIGAHQLSGSSANTGAMYFGVTF